MIGGHEVAGLEHHPGEPAGAVEALAIRGPGAFHLALELQGPGLVLDQVERDRRGRQRLGDHPQHGADQAIRLDLVRERVTDHARELRVVRALGNVVGEGLGDVGRAVLERGLRVAVRRRLFRPLPEDLAHVKREDAEQSEILGSEGGAVFAIGGAQHPQRPPAAGDGRHHQGFRGVAIATAPAGEAIVVLQVVDDEGRALADREPGDAFARGHGVHLLRGDVVPRCRRDPERAAVLREHHQRRLRCAEHHGHRVRHVLPERLDPFRWVALPRALE